MNSKKDKQLVIGVSVDERAIFQAVAKWYGKSVSAFMRDAAMEIVLRTHNHPEQQILKRLTLPSNLSKTKSRARRSVHALAAVSALRRPRT